MHILFAAVRVAVTPEPATVWLVGVGLSAVGLIRYSLKRKKK